MGSKPGLVGRTVGMAIAALGSSSLAALGPRRATAALRASAAATLLASLLVAPAASALSIDEIVLEIEVSKIDDANQPFQAEFIIQVAGDMLTDVTVTPSGGSPVSLDFNADTDIGPAFEKRTVFPSLEQLKAQFPVDEDYTFDFNSGSTLKTLNYPNLEPPGFVDITSPSDGDTTSTTPTLAWESCPTCGAVNVLLLFLDDQTTDQDLIELEFSPPADGSIVLPGGPITPSPIPPGPNDPVTLDALIPGHTYEFSLELLNADPMSPLLDPNDIGSAFEYFPHFENITRVEFTTEPGPGIPMVPPLGLIVFAALMLGSSFFMLRRRLGFRT